MPAQGGLCPRNDESAGKRRSTRLRKGAPGTGSHLWTELALCDRDEGGFVIAPVTALVHEATPIKCTLRDKQLLSRVDGRQGRFWAPVLLLLRRSTKSRRPRKPCWAFQPRHWMPLRAHDATLARVPAPLIYAKGGMRAALG